MVCELRDAIHDAARTGSEVLPTLRALATAFETEPGLLEVWIRLALAARLGMTEPHALDAIHHLLAFHGASNEFLAKVGEAIARTTPDVLAWFNVDKHDDAAVVKYVLARAIELEASSHGGAS